MPIITPSNDDSWSVSDNMRLRLCWQDVYGGRAAELAALYPGLGAGTEKAESDLIGDQMFGACAACSVVHSVH